MQGQTLYEYSFIYNEAITHTLGLSGKVDILLKTVILHTRKHNYYHFHSMFVFLVPYRERLYKYASLINRNLLISAIPGLLIFPTYYLQNYETRYCNLITPD